MPVQRAQRKSRSKAPQVDANGQAIQYSNVDENGNHITRPLNPFFLFRMLYCSAIRKIIPRISQKSISQCIKPYWKTWPQCHRDAFFKLAELEKAEFNRRYPYYKYKPLTPAEKAELKAQGKLKKSESDAYSRLDTIINRSGWQLPVPAENVAKDILIAMQNEPESSSGASPADEEEDDISPTEETAPRKALPQVTAAPLATPAVPESNQGSFGETWTQAVNDASGAGSQTQIPNPSLFSGPSSYVYNATIAEYHSLQALPSGVPFLHTADTFDGTVQQDTPWNFDGQSLSAPEISPLDTTVAAESDKSSLYHDEYSLFPQPPFDTRQVGPLSFPVQYPPLLFQPMPNLAQSSQSYPSISDNTPYLGGPSFDMSRSNSIQSCATLLPYATPAATLYSSPEADAPTPDDRVTTFDSLYLREGSLFGDASEYVYPPQDVDYGITQSWLSIPPNDTELAGGNPMWMVSEQPSSVLMTPPNEPLPLPPALPHLLPTCDSPTSTTLPSFSRRPSTIGGK